MTRAGLALKVDSPPRRPSTMPLLLRRKIRCHFCNQQSRHAVSRIPRTYLCPQCDAVNYFDEVRATDSRQANKQANTPESVRRLTTNTARARRRPPR